MSKNKRIRELSKTNQAVGNAYLMIDDVSQPESQAITLNDLKRSILKSNKELFDYEGYNEFTLVYSPVVVNVRILGSDIITELAEDDYILNGSHIEIESDLLENVNQIEFSYLH